MHERAPDAEILVVGYPQPVPANGTCPELPLAAGDYAEARAQLGQLDDAMRAAAEAQDARFVDVLGASDGHDICAGSDAWVNGAQDMPGEAVVYHPFRSEQEAIAQLVVDALHSS